MPNSLSAAHIVSANNIANYEAARSGFFTLIVDDIDNIIRANYTGEAAQAGTGDKIAQAQQILKLNVVKAKVPHFSLTPIEYRGGNDVVKFAGVPQFEAGSIVVDDIVGLDTKSIVMAWQHLAYNVHTRKGGRMKDYKKQCTLCEYTQDFELVRSWKLHGCWVSSISEADFDKESNGDKRQITATIEYDRAEMELPATANEE